MEFWPSHYLDDQRIEPDVVIFGSSRTLIVEAKRHDHSLQQYAKQLARELLAATHSDSDIQRPVLLTIGGMKEYSESTTAALGEEIDADLSDSAMEYELICRSWHQVYLALQTAISTSEPDNDYGLQRLQNDIAMAYEWHGLRTQGYRWLAQLSSAQIDTTAFPAKPFSHPFSKSTDKTLSLSKPLFQIRAADISFCYFPVKSWSYSK